MKSFPFSDETRRCQLAQIAWAQRSVRERLQLLRAFRHLLAERAEKIALTVTQDIGRPVDELLGTDLLPTLDACRFLERRAAAILQTQSVPRSDRPIWLMGASYQIARRPHGIVGIIGTWNYPIFLNVVQILQALIAGNGVLWKPSELVPTFAEELESLLREAGFPNDLLIRLPATREAGPDLVEANIQYLVFTGSSGVGRQLAKRLGERLIPSTLELSGCDAMLVLEDANIPLSARAAWYGVNLNKGQTCLAVRRIFVQRSCYQAFLTELARYSPLSRPEPLALMGQVQQAERLIQDGLALGAKILPGLAVPQAEDNPPRFAPTILQDATPEMAICQEAAFAPIAAVIPFDTLEHGLAAINQCPLSLGASLFTQNLGLVETIARQLPVGSLTVNDVIAPTAHPATPFAAIGGSGWGTTQGTEGLLGMTVPQAISKRKDSFRPHFDGVFTKRSGQWQNVIGDGALETWRELDAAMEGFMADNPGCCLSEKARIIKISRLV